MAVINYNPLIEYASGAFAKPQKKDGHKHGNYIIGTHRVAETQNPDCTRMYIKKADAYKRTTPLTQKEGIIRLRFKSIAAAVAQRAGDLNKMSADQAAFLAQKNTAGGKKTFRAYLWSLETEAYDAAHNG